LATVLTNLEFLGNLPRGTSLGEDEVAAALADSERALRRAVELTRQLLGFARQGKYQDRPISLGAICEEVLRLVRRSMSSSITFEVEIDGDEVVVGDPNQLHQVLMNLVINGCDAMADGGKLTIRIRRGSDDPSGSPSHLLAHRPHVVVEVEDTGVGMDEETRARAFEPFFTTKPIGRGTGLGLAMVYGIVKNHGGDVQVESEVGRRTVVRMFLPAAAELGDGGKKTETSNEEGTGATVLVIDDDDLFRSGTSRLLRHLGYRVLEAQNGSEAIDVYQRWHNLVSVVLLDVAMPGLDGFATFEAIRGIMPHARILMMTGNEEPSEAEVEARGAQGILRKPFDAVSLQRTLSLAIG
jgi:CheY-like chemotaxis protein